MGGIRGYSNYNGLLYVQVQLCILGVNSFTTGQNKGCIFANLYDCADATSFVLKVC